MRSPAAAGRLTAKPMPAPGVNSAFARGPGPGIVKTVRFLATVPAVLTAASVAMAGVESLRERSPFVPPAAPQQADANANALSTFELTGILSVGGKPQFSVRDTATGRSFWLGLGETQEGLTARSYDADTSSVVLEGRGARRNIVIREARVTTAVPPPPALAAVASQARQPPNPQIATGATQPAAQPVTPAAKKQAVDAKGRTNEEAERDARLLVSDLMELSVQERRRYEENQRRLARGLPRLAPDEPLPPGTP
jgi:hypothetical protein